jgi:hypothetical protein
VLRVLRGGSYFPCCRIAARAAAITKEDNMCSRDLWWCGLVALVLAAVLAVPVAAQVEDQLSAYTGENATGYVQPLADSFGATLNSGFFRTAYIPTTGPRISVELLVMGLYFSDDQRTFPATTEGMFLPEQTAAAPTIVGSNHAMIIDGSGGAKYAFPGGLDMDSFGMLAPQLRIGALFGTEAVFRYAVVNTGDSEIGDLNLLGLGARHSVSQYFGKMFPVDLAIGFIWQSFTVGENSRGEDLIDSDALSIGVQASKRLPFGFATFEPYTALSYDSFQMTLDYDSDATGTTEPIKVDFDRQNTGHWTFGLNFNLVIASLYAEYNVASTSSFGFGLAVGNLGF